MDTEKISKQILALCAVHRTLRLVHDDHVFACESADRDLRESEEGLAAEKNNEHLDNAIFKIKEAIAELGYTIE